MRHRGPDHQAVEVLRGGAILGHARLSIIDLCARANQPMHDRGRRYWITYNGEVYNFAEIRSELQGRGHVFETTSDTEVVLQAIIEWGAGAFRRFNGMFALAVWDSQERELLVARDRFGKKPVYYTQIGGGFSFASELTGLLEDDAVRRRAVVSVEALNQYFAIGYTLTPLCIADGIFKLQPASFIRYRDGKVVEASRYWEYADAFRRPRKGSTEDLARELGQRLETAVRRRLVSDVPVGSFLSGGIDSSGVVSFARKTLDYTLHTFSIGFSEPTYDESAAARQVAGLLGSVHHERVLRLEDGPRLMDAAIGCFDEPFSDTSLVPMVEVAQIAAAHVKVVLSGDGSDELMAGYPTYKADALRRRLQVLPGGVRRAMGRTLPALIKEGRNKTGLGFRLRQFAKGLSAEPWRAHYAWRELHTEPERIRLIGEQFSETIRDTDPFRVFERYYREVSDLDPLSQHLYVDAKTWLVDDILVKLDRSTMAASIEARTPFLDVDLVEFVASLPSELKLKNLRGKMILRHALEQAVPAVALRRPKAGFNAPINSWLGNYSENEFRVFNKYVEQQWTKRGLLPGLTRDDVLGAAAGAQVP
jgi:asparagine synthase (glutamine-hydrolysing)